MTLLQLLSERIGQRRKIARHEMAALLQEWSTQNPGALLNGYVYATVPPGVNELNHVPSDEELRQFLIAAPESYHRQAARTWALMAKGSTVISCSDAGALRDGNTRYDQPGSMAPGQHADVLFLPSRLGSRAETRDYLRGKCHRLLIVDESSPLILPPEHRDVDGQWVRYIYTTTLPVDWMDAKAFNDYLDEFGGEEPNSWEQAVVEQTDETDPFRILQMIDPNSGQGWDARAKQRYQYVLLKGRVFTRMLPPESVGDVWLDEPGVRPFQPADRERGAGASVGDYITTLLTLT